MHILVTGGSGFIGTALCRALIARGDGVTVLTRDVARARQRLPQSVHCIDDLAQAAPAEAVVNLAGENLGDGRWSAARKQRFVDSRVQTTRRLIDWMQTGPRPQVLVSASAIGWYGARGDEELGENASPGRPDEFSAQLCRAWEAEALQAEGLGVRTCLLRIGIVLERDGGSLQQLLLPFRLGLGGVMGSGAQWMSWIHRDDLVGLILWLIDTPQAQGAYNGTAPQPARHREFVRTLARTLRRPALIPIPAPALRLLLGEMAGLVLEGQRVLPQRALRGGYVFRYPDLATALAAILAPRRPQVH
ncbi:TIGR01777 family oxidoreductase [Sinimarinibacterium thermocellulolyticum]|uniref:TIGR01777 family oxidoreductase n=1 Tax=Sinimarinibacterium thermocellulolyticum TaxID=3170016 RepID=A0ABV2A9T4_9GAMM